MKTILTSLSGCVIVEPAVFEDERGFFFEAFNLSRPNAPFDGFNAHQINVSRSSRNVLRGLHFQDPEPQGKLVWVLEGEVFDLVINGTSASLSGDLPPLPNGLLAANASCYDLRS